VSDSVRFDLASTEDDLAQILDLQAQNHRSALTAAAMADQGFVTVRHEPAVLARMQAAAPAVVARAGDRLVGYALVMPRAFAADVPIIAPLFTALDALEWRGVPLRANPRWFVMGQVCVAASHRGQGVFDGLYRTLAERYRDRYQFTVTEVAARNTRSLRAHHRVGFQTLHIYPDLTTGEDWHVIVLDL
jgi:L-amino acid N-acyltransferase YncA